MASCQLPRPDFHRLADDSFAGHTNALLGALIHGTYTGKSKTKSFPVQSLINI